MWESIASALASFGWIGVCAIIVVIFICLILFVRFARVEKASPKEGLDFLTDREIAEKKAIEKNTEGQ